MYKLYNKKTIEGLSPLVVEKAEKDYIQMITKGYSKQATSTTGKNKFTGNKINSGNALGITYSFDNSILKINGTTTAVGNIFLDFTGETLKAGTYTYSIRTKSGTFNIETSGSDIALYLKDQDNNFITGKFQTSGITLRDLMATGNKSKSFTITEDIENLKIILFTNDKDIVITNLELEIQIESGNIASAFEHFIPTMPSPNYPSRIRNVGDNIQLFDLKNYYNSAGVTNCGSELLNNGIRLKFTEGQDAWIGAVRGKDQVLPEALRIGCQKVKPNTTYTLKISSVPKCYMSFLDKSYTATETYKQIPKSVYTFTTNSSTYYIYLRLGYQSSTSGLTSYDFTDIKLEEGSTATPYTEYGCGSVDYEINTTQNIFNKDTDIELDGQYISYVTGNIATNQNYYGVKIKVEGNKEYKVFSYQNYSNLCYFDKNMTYISGEVFEKNSYNYIFSTPQNCVYITLAVAKNGINEFSVTEAKTIHFPLSEGQLLHEEDYLAEDGIHQKRKTIVLDGTEDIQKSSKYSGSFYIRNFLTGSKDFGDILCNYATRANINKRADISATNYVYGNTFIEENEILNLWITQEDLTLEQFKSYLAEQYANGTPVIVEYELAEEIITPLTAKQQNVIDNIELFEGYNQINSLDEFDFEMKIIYTPQFTEDIRKAFRTGITKAYLEVIGTDVVIDYQNYLKNIEFSELRFVPDKGIFGQAVAKKIVVNFNNLDNTLNLQDKEIRLFIETEVDGENYRIKYGDFIVQHPENENVNDNTSLTGLDYMIKTNVKYVDTITYPCTLRQLANNICTQCGLTLSKESFKNENFVVENNQFVSGETCRQIIQGIALSAFSWARIDENNELHFDFDKDFSIKEELTNDDYYNLDFNKELYGPTNRIIIRDSQIDGENVTISDDESIATNGVNEIVIEDNPFAYTQEKREQLIEAGKDLFGFSYLPINSSKLIGYIYLNCLDRIKIKNMQGQSFETYLFNHIINYEGTALDTIEVPAMTKTETKYTFTPDITQALKNTQIIVDKANQNILGIIEKQEGQSSQITSIEASLDGINTKIQDNQDDINERFNKIETTLEGTTQVLSNKGGNNIFYYAKEFWTDGTENGTAKLNEYTDTEVQKISVSGNGYKINKGTSEQKVNVKNDIYTISFTYKKLIDLATGYVLINNERIDLSSSEWKEEVITLNIDTNNVDFKIISDTDNAFEIYDLMGTIGEEKQIWTQNPNETRTDTVTIGKGIEVKSSSKNTYARFDADGNRIFNNSTNQVVTALTDKGVETNEIDSELGKIGGILIQKMSGQTWISSLL